MDCPYLETGTKSRFCGASITRLIPGMEETAKYCKTEEHYRCPMLLAHVLRGGREGAAGLINLN